MNDFEYDCLKKKQIAQQARHRKRGNKSKKCSLSTDYMTQKQWKERCGAILSININSPVAWETFKELGKKTQEEYVRHLMDVYGVNATSLGAMFDVQPLTVRRYFVAKKLDISFPVGKSMNAEQKVAWEGFLSGEPTNATQPEAPQQDVEEKTDDTSAVRPQMNMKKVSLSFSGKIDISAISNSLLHVLGSDAVGDVEIVCSLT